MSARDVAEMALKIRSLLPDAVDECAEIRVFGKRLADILSLPRGGSSFWFGPLAEKNPLKTREFTWLAQALAGIKPSGRPRGAVSDLFRALAAVVQIAVRGVIARRVVGPPPRDFADGFRPIAVTYFPYVDRAAARSGNFVNRYFAPVQHMRQMDWVLMFVKADGYGFLRAVLLAKRFADNGERLVFLDAFLSLSQCWLMFKYVLLSAVMYLSSRGHIQKNMPAPSPEWRPILTALIRRAFFGVEAARSHAAWVAFKRIFAECVNADAKCVYLAEMQSWEAALNLAAKSEGIKTFGYQHSPAARNRAFWKHGPLQMDRMPLPDVVLCDGQSAMADMMEYGYMDVRLVETLRYGHIARKRHPKRMDRDLTLLAVGTIVPEENVGIVEFLSKAIPHIQNWRVIFKPHPSGPIKICDARIETSVGDMDGLLSVAHVVFTGTSSVAAEALAYGCDVILLSPHDGPLLNILEGFVALRETADAWYSLATQLQWKERHGFSIGEKAKREFARDFWHRDPGFPKWREILEG